MNRFDRIKTCVIISCILGNGHQSMVIGMTSKSSMFGFPTHDRDDHDTYTIAFGIGIVISSLYPIDRTVAGAMFTESALNHD